MSFSLLDRKKIEEKYSKITPPWGPIGYVVFKRTYARPVEDGKRTEEWWEMLLRCVNSIQEDIMVAHAGQPFDESELYALYDHLFHMRAMLAGRDMWQLGTPLVKKGLVDSLHNCWLSCCDSIQSICFAFEESALGGGVTSIVTEEYVKNLPPVRPNVKIRRKDGENADYIIDDCREGWVSLLKKVLTSFLVSGESFTYSTHLLRPYGAKINGYGGYSCGPEPLASMVSSLVSIFYNREGQRLRPNDVGDIINVIGYLINKSYRRNAQMLIADPEDSLFLRRNRWDLQDVPVYRSMSNDTIQVEDIRSLDHNFWETYTVPGEPIGIQNLELARKVGRLGSNDPADPAILGTNPCGEEFLERYGRCLLKKLVLMNLSSMEQAKEVTSLLWRLSKAICMGDYLYKESKEVSMEYMRIGITPATLNEPHIFSDDDLLTISNFIDDYDKQLSKQWGVNRSIRRTTVQPEGTGASLYGSGYLASPGVHQPLFRFGIRRVRMGNAEKLLDICRANGYHVEPVKNIDGSEDPHLSVVEFPCMSNRSVKTANEVTAIDQLEKQLKLQRIWADASVSCTVHFKKEELPQIKTWLEENYQHFVKSVSFLQYSEHGFMQAPYEPLTEQQYLEKAKQVKPITSVNVNTFTENVQADCSKGTCTLR